jgi:hypothetical protein
MGDRRDADCIRHAAGVGGERFDRDGDLDGQARRIAEICARKLDSTPTLFSALDSGN